MKYVLLICNDESVLPSKEELATDPVHQAWVADREGRGAKLFGAVAAGRRRHDSPGSQGRDAGV